MRWANGQKVQLITQQEDSGGGVIQQMSNKFVRRFLFPSAAHHHQSRGQAFKLLLEDGWPNEQARERHTSTRPRACRS